MKSGHGAAVFFPDDNDDSATATTDVCCSFVGGLRACVRRLLCARMTSVCATAAAAVALLSMCIVWIVYV